jgi:hypothetical protein
MDTLRVQQCMNLVSLLICSNHHEAGFVVRATYNGPHTDNAGTR